VSPQRIHKKIKNKTTTDDVIFEKIVVAGSPFQKIDEASLTAFLKKYEVKLLCGTLDILIETYKKTGKQINDPAAILANGLSKGVIPPTRYVPYLDRAENDVRQLIL
jgi:hypothetical protein